MRRLLGSGVLIALVVVLIVVVALVPLFLVHRGTCGRGQDRGTEYNFVAPWNDPPTDCRANQSGFDVVKDAVGLD